MKIEAGSVVTLAYEIHTPDGKVVESSAKNGPISFIHGTGAILRGLDDRLEGMRAGEEARFEFPPEQAFGRPEDAPQKVVSRAEFPKEAKLQAGARFEAGIPGGQRILLDVVEVQGEAVRVRMVHPLAGQRIGMSVKVLGVRLATPEELESGKVAEPPPVPAR
jgi:FKBP-type peptidyl-prolyl cis-trans isomerase SlyD